MRGLDIASETAASSEARVEPRSGSKQARARGEQGGAMTEFAFVLPVFLMILFGFIWFGISLYNNLVLTSATNYSAQYLSSVATMTTGPGANPCQYTANTFYGQAPGLIHANLSFTINYATGIASSGPPVTYNWTNAITNETSPTCGSFTQTAGLPVQLVVSYQCQLSLILLNIPCKLTAQSSYISQ